MTATPRPWTFDPAMCLVGATVNGQDYRSPIHDDGGDGHLVCFAHGFTKEEAENKAALIVKAVNRHDAMVEALSDVLTWIDNWDPDFSYDPEWEDSENKARAALKLARGET